MKTFCILLSFYIISLTMLPSLQVVSGMGKREHCEKLCCQHDQKKKESKEKGGRDCSGKGCNPFMSCCNGFALHNPSWIYSGPVVFTELTFPAPVERPYSDFLSEAWHPPRV